MPLPEPSRSTPALLEPAPPFGLYIHVPYCVSICPYCDFVVVAGAASRGSRSSIGRFLAAVEVELRLRADVLDAAFGAPGTRPRLETLYLGGGTPSLLAAEAIARLVELVRERYGLVREAEVTIEANPGRDERGDAVALRAAGVTRLSIGGQSFDDGELRRIGRRHRSDDLGDTIAAAREAGIPSVSLDLLYDIPGQSLESWDRTLDRALALEPDHLSLYALTLDDPDAEGLTGPLGDHLPTTAGAARWRRAARSGQDDDRAARMYELADRRLAGAGYAWYEISNWARPGHRSRHNLAYWQRRPVDAVGPGAHAFDGRERRWNAAPLGAWTEALVPAVGAAPRLPPGGAEVLGEEPASAEAVILALRTADGARPARGTEERAGAVAGGRPADWLETRLGPAMSAGLVDRRPDGRFVLTLRGRLLSNEVFASLLPA